MKNKLLIITVFVASVIAAPAENLALLLQKGLAEEEINRDPAAAIEHYGALLEEFYKSRQLAATALFRIAECSRKLGDEDVSAKNLEQLIALYPKQEKLVALARESLTALRVAPVLTPSDGVKMSEEEANYIIRYKEILRNRPNAIKNGQYLMHCTAEHHVSAARFLLEQGANPNYALGGISVIYDAVKIDNLSIVQLLLSHGADVTPDALALCIDREYSSIEPVLLADIKSKSKNFDYFPAFEKCIERNRKDAFDRLVANGADPKMFGDGGETLLLTAAEYGRSEFCERLIKIYGIPVKHRNKRGVSALDYAAHKRSPETVKVLLSHGADPQALAGCHLMPDHVKHGDNIENVSVLMQLLNLDGYQANHDAIIPIIDQLITAGVDVNHQDSYGFTVLHYATYYSDSDVRHKYGQILTAKDRVAVIVALLNAGADKNLKDKGGVTPKEFVTGKGFGAIFGIEPK